LKRKKRRGEPAAEKKKREKEGKEKKRERKRKGKGRGEEEGGSLTNDDIFYTVRGHGFTAKC
ncbi:hypothetical protein Lal_00030312, partial [Lupinus albus]